MKINYNKSEVFVVGIDELEGGGIVDAFNCKLGVWLMKYLGLPIGFNKLSKAQLSGPAEKIEKRLQTWKCGHLSYGGEGDPPELNFIQHTHLHYGALLVVRGHSPEDGYG